jgi:hypothetical protein
MSSTDKIWHRPPTNWGFGQREQVLPPLCIWIASLNFTLLSLGECLTFIVFLSALATDQIKLRGSLPLKSNFSAFVAALRTVGSSGTSLLDVSFIIIIIIVIIIILILTSAVTGQYPGVDGNPLPLSVFIMERPVLGSSQRDGPWSKGFNFKKSWKIFASVLVMRWSSSKNQNQNQIITSMSGHFPSSGKLCLAASVWGDEHSPTK